MKHLGILSLLSVATGFLLSYVANPHIIIAASWVSQGFMNLLKLLSLPVIFFSLSSTIATLGIRGSAGDVLIRTIRLAMLTTGIAAVLAWIIYQLIDPAQGLVKVGIDHHAPVFEVSVKELIPDNLFAMFEQHNVVGIVLFAMIFGWLVTELPDSERDFMQKALGSVYALFIRMAELLMWLLPFVVWAFILELLKQENPSETFHLLGGYLTCILISNLVQGLIVLPLILALFQVSVTYLFRAVYPALMMAAMTKSSTATLPLTLSCVKSNTEIDERESEAILPLCATINMNGCAAFIFITVLFVSQVNGVDFSLFDQILWILLSIVAAFGNAGVPMGCFFMASAYLVNMNVSTDMMGLILPFYTIIDMIETPINIWSDVCILAIVDRRRKVT